MKGKIFRAMILQMILVILAGGDVFAHAPFLVAWFAALYMIKEIRLITIPVAVASVFLWMSPVQGGKYALLFLTYMFLYWFMEKIMNKSAKNYHVAILAGALTLLFELVDDTMNQVAAGSWARYFPAFFMLGVFFMTLAFHKVICLIYQVTYELIFRNDEILCIGILTGVVVYCLKQENILNLPFAIGVSYFLIAFCGYKFGAGMGGVAGCACGLALTIWNGDMGLFGTMCFLGILSGGFRELGRIGTLAGLFSGVAICGIFYKQAILDQTWLIALAAAGIVFMVLPGSLMYRFQKLERNSEGFQKSVQMRKDERLKNIASAFEQLAKSFGKIPPKKDEMSFMEVNRMVEEVSETVCVNCTRYEECWRRGKYEAYKETSELFKAAYRNGMVGKRDVNRQFFNRCKNVNELILEVNHLYETQRVNMLWHNRLVDSKYAVATQLEEVSDIIRDFSKESYQGIGITAEREEWIRRKLRAKKLRMRRMTVLKNRQGRIEVSMVIKSLKGTCISTKEIERIVGEALDKSICLSKNSKSVLGNEYTTMNFIEDTNFQVICGAAKFPKGKNSVSGDNFGFTSLSSGQVLMAISDGMGYGQSAYAESETVVELLEELMESGFRSEVALRLINMVMMVNSNSCDTATADMGILDLYSGICQFVKLGAAPTFIKRGNWVEVIKSTSLPLGVLKQIDLERTNKKIYDGDIIVMVSDGMIDGLRMNDKEQELSELIRTIDTNQPKEFAARLLQKVRETKLNDVSDDMTVLVGTVWQKN